MIGDFLEAIQLVGSIVGLLSGAFIVYDRLFRWRPTVYLGPKEFHVHLFFRNVSDETIVINEVTFEPKFAEIARANDLITVNEERQKSFYPTTAGKDDPRFEGNYIVLKGLEERDFAIHRYGDFESANDDVVLKIRCRWENTRRPWPFRRYVKVLTTVGKVKRLREAAVAGKR
jgi:hypothetical protein